VTPTIPESEPNTVEESIIGYLSAPWCEWTETYVVANSIGLRGQTPKVRRALRRLEATGRVLSKDSWRHNMLEWKLAIPPLNTEEAETK
jgi:hypothetical protein